MQRLLLGTLALALAGWLAGAWLMRKWTARPPPLPSDTAILSLKPETREGKVWLGRSWAGRREGLPVVCLKGSPLEIGYAHGLLLQQQMHTLENEFIQMIHLYVPQDWKVQLLKDYVIYRNRHLTDCVPLNYRLEIYGTTLGCPDIHPEEGSFYNRMLNYHAAHDVSYMMIDNPLVSRARQSNLHIMLAVLEHTHCDGFSLTHQVQDEIFAGQFHRIQRDAAGVDQDVVGKEIRQDHISAGAVHVQLGRARPRLDLDQIFTTLHTEFRSHRLLVSG